MNVFSLQINREKEEKKNI